MTSRSGIELPRVEGNVSRQAHADLPAGTFEREIGREGFFGPATHMYHRHPPTGWTSFEGPLRPRAFDAAALAEETGNPFMASPLLSNDHVKLRSWACRNPMKALACNADGDDLIFVHQGSGGFFCDYGHLSYHEGDYLLLPRGTAWRLVPSSRTVVMLIEATNEAYRLPERGLLGPHAIFDPAVLDTPRIDDAFKAQQDERPWSITIKRRQLLSKLTYPFNPLDAMGWKGTLSVLRLNWRDIRPVMSPRYHIPPSVHSTFVTERFAVCTFVPRPLESDPGALKVPFFHSNNDYEEAIFYHRGSFFSRDNIRPGMVTFHPGGFPHGPHPKALAASASASRTETDEVAVMIDARDPLDMSEHAASTEDRLYADSWKSK